MTEERFELVFIGGDTFITDNESHINHFVGFEDVRKDFKCIVECLNNLHEENQQQKKKIEYLQKLRMEIRDVTIEEAIDKIKEMWE